MTRFRRRCAFAALVTLVAFAASTHAAASPLRTWVLGGGELVAGTASDDAIPVGSLIKPFVARAWALAHPGATPPVVRCDTTSGCWRPSGHGTVDLATSEAVSCNTYFKRLAAETPPDILRSQLVDAGFRTPAVLTPETVLGIDASGMGLPRIRPESLLRAYVRLTREPWPAGEATRRAVLAGLRRAALEGTASGVGRFGLWAKTGTVGALDGAPLGTSGLVVVVDDAGWAAMGLLARGTGREAARLLSAEVERRRPALLPHAEARPPAPRRATLGAPRSGHGARRPEGAVDVRLFDLLRPRSIAAVNVGTLPTATARGFVGPGGSLDLQTGDVLEDGLWELRVGGTGLVRRIAGGVRAVASESGSRVIATVTPREYVDGVLRAELPDGDAALRIELGAAVLRFLAEGPRHADADVCDSTHCAWFVGRGPSVRWGAPHRVRHGAFDPVAPLGGEEWSRVLALARIDGPARFTADCGGEPLSAHAVWGGGDRRVFAARHDHGGTSTWAREWSRDEAARVFGAVSDLRVVGEDGVWGLQVEGPNGAWTLRFDEAHARIARVKGWNALPSPAARVVKTAVGFRVEGVGSGHRVGLCLRRTPSVPAVAAREGG